MVSRLVGLPGRPIGRFAAAKSHRNIGRHEAIFDYERQLRSSDKQNPPWFQQTFDFLQGFSLRCLIEIDQQVAAKNKIVISFSRQKGIAQQIILEKSRAVANVRIKNEPLPGCSKMT